MNAQQSLWNRLILLVLCLNLVCLALLLYRAYWGPRPQEQTSPSLIQQTTWVAQSKEPDKPRAGTTTFRPLRPPANANVSPEVEAPGNNDPTPPANQQQPATIPVAPTAAPPLVNLPSRASKATPVTAVAPGTAGLPELSGRVTLKGVPPPEIPIDMGPACAPLQLGPVTTRHYVVGAENGLANVLVWLKNVANWRQDLPAMETPVIDQRGCMFEPYVIGVVAGQKFRILNSDATLHNVHATPRNNREFNFGMPTRGLAQEVSFPNAELFIRLKCDVHPWMFAYVNVLDHPFFAITDTNGAFHLPAGFPPGRYVVGAKHLKAGETSRELDLPAGPHSVELELQVPAAQARVR